jgi:DNA-3-methyladenine glycosylase I
MTEKSRCSWCKLNNEAYVRYHDEEWCQPCYEEKYLYEMLILESFQAGLSWECVLNKREAFRAAFDDFDIDKVCSYGEDKMTELMENKDIIRNRLKIKSAVNNSIIFRDIQHQYGSFYDYIKTFTKGKIYYETNRTTSPLSDEISRDLQKKGMKFAGSTIIYSYLQAIGIIYSHDKGCWLYHKD